ncbi:hypothetical protein [Streptomyces sp. NPDC048527]|uniref:hypothetical protein n=1 Tax=Streptomyces sp. NPDC048527 TaxID=3365568 RepID=UPI00370FCF23
MKNAHELLLAYLDSVADPDKAAALFAEDGAIELPYLTSLASRHAPKGEKPSARS